jgi:hypothetical protein
MYRRLFIISTLALAAQTHAAEAGKVIFVAGNAQVAERPAAEGLPVQEGEMLTTGADGFLYVKTIDNGLFILRPGTKARIVAYHVDVKNPSNTHIKLELLSGVARSKSGDAVKLARQNFRFNTPVAAIGVRGTDFTVWTDQDTSNVAVLTGGVVVSGFAGACRPEGGGPCTGATSRELSATQRGQLLQIKRGQAEPQLLQGASNSPDQVSPPRGDEPLAKNGASEPVLDAKKNESLNQIVAQQPPPSTPPVTPTPVVDVGVPTPPPPSLPEREIQWGRWTPLLGLPVTASLAGPAGADRIVEGSYVLYRTAGKDYVAPERGNVGFALKNSEAYILNDDPAKATVAALVQNGQLNVDFGKATFVTTFDLLGNGEVFKMKADGSVTPDGQFGNAAYVRPATNNMTVNGLLSNANGGAAAYLFRSRLDDTRVAKGVTVWGH